MRLAIADCLLALLFVLAALMVGASINYVIPLGL